MDVRIDVGGGGAAAPGELAGWLRREPELRGLVREVPRPPRPDAMAVPVDLVVSVLSSAALGTVARSVRTYLEHRRSDVSVELETDRGRVRVTVTDAEDPQALVRKLGEIIALSPEPEPDPDPHPHPHPEDEE